MTLQDQEDRVLLMAQNSPTWDLSTNDREALAAVLEALTTERRDHQHWLAEGQLSARLEFSCRGSSRITTKEHKWQQRRRRAGESEPTISCGR